MVAWCCRVRPLSWETSGKKRVSNWKSCSRILSASSKKLIGFWRQGIHSSSWTLTQRSWSMLPFQVKFGRLLYFINNKFLWMFDPFVTNFIVIATVSLPWHCWFAIISSALLWHRRYFLVKLFLLPPHTHTHSNLFTGIIDRSQVIQVAVIREEGSNGDREMASSLFMAGFEVWDINMQDLLGCSVDLDRFRGVVFVGGFSYADVFGSGKGWSVGWFN